MSKHITMKTIRIIFVLLTAVMQMQVAAAVGDGFVVKGCVADSTTSAGEPYATISVAKADAPAKPVKMGVTDKNGRFSLNVSGNGRFVLTASSMGRNNVVKEFSADTGKGTVDLGTLYMSDADNLLKGVEVVAQKPLVKADIDKIEYDMESDPDSKANSLLEMLRKVPLVTVDGQDNIQVNGSSSFKVYVNGKPNNMMSNNPSEVLKSMPANTIKKIEVITNPGPKYDAEGVGGILNIITVDSGFEGYTATISANGRNTGGGGGMFATVKSGKLTVSARYNYNYNSQPRGYSDNSITTTGDEPASTSADMTQKGSSKNSSGFHSGSIEASYEIDSLNLVSASFGLWGGKFKSEYMSSTLGTAPADGNTLYSYSTLGNSSNPWYSIDGSIDYQHTFKTKDRMLTLSYKINTNPDKTDSYTDYTETDAGDEWQDFISRLENQHNNGDRNNTEHTFQADFTTPIGKIHTIETGAKYILRKNSADDDRYVRPAGSTGDYTFDEDHSSHYRHENDIIAAYAGYGLKLKKLSGRLGLRYEHTIQDVRYLLGRGEDFRKHFNDFVPSASIGYSLTDTQNFRLGYNMRIYRPGIWYLNPYLNDSDPTSISQGNPNLDSEKSHSFSLGYNNFTSKFSLNVSMRYRFTNNSIDSYTSLMADNDIAGLQNPTGKNVLYTTYRNMGRSRLVSMSLYANWNPTSSTRIYTNMYGAWQYFSDGESLSNKGWYASAYGGIQQTLPKDWQISFNIFGQSPWVSLQGKGDKSVGYTLNVNKSFMKKRLNLSAYAGNFFRKYRIYENTTESTGFIQRSSYKFNQQYFGISASFRIGELKASVKKTERSINNDDVKGGGDNSGGKS